MTRAGATLSILGVAGVIAAAPSLASADPTSGVDGALFRASYDVNGVFTLEGARLLPKRDLSMKFLGGFGRAPISFAVPGIGSSAGDVKNDRILDYLVVLDMAIGMSLTERIGLGIDVAAFRTATGTGYGQRGRYSAGGMTSRSTGLVALRPLSNIDPSASQSDEAAYLGDGLAGPLDVRGGLKLALLAHEEWALTLVGSVFLPFGEDEMLLGDRGIVFEPKLAAERRTVGDSTTLRVVGNVGARIRKRTVIEGFDTQDSAMTEADAKVALDIGSEVVAGLGSVISFGRQSLGAEAVAYMPLPENINYGSCVRFTGVRCSSITSADYFADAKYGDFVLAITGVFNLHITADITWNIAAGASAMGARGDEIRFTSGLTWSPQPFGAAVPGSNDRDGDAVPDTIDGCTSEREDKDNFEDEDGCPDLDNDSDGLPDADDQCADEPEDKDGFKDGDGCREGDNDNDGILDAADKCPDQGEDLDGFEDDDGCLDQDNDGDGFADAADKCPNDAETVNGVDDDDGCPDVRATTGPEERPDRIDLKGAQVTFTKGTSTLTAPAKQLLGQVATMIKNRKLSIRVEVHVALGTKATAAAAITAQKRKDKTLAQTRAKAISDYLVSQGVTVQQLQAVGIGSDRPLGTAGPADPINERVDFIKSQQGGTP